MRKTQANPWAASAYRERVENGRPTGVIVKDFVAYPNCETFDWKHIEEITK